MDSLHATMIFFGFFNLKSSSIVTSQVVVVHWFLSVDCVFGCGFSEALKIACANSIANFRFGDASWWVMIVVWDWQRFSEFCRLRPPFSSKSQAVFFGCVCVFFTRSGCCPRHCC